MIHYLLLVAPTRILVTLIVFLVVLKSLAVDLCYGIVAPRVCNK